MRLPILLSAALAVSACAATPQQEVRSPRAQQELDRYLTGRVAGSPQTCLPTFRSQDMVVIDENTVLFRDGRRLWRVEMQGGCSGLGRPGVALVTRQFGTSQLCRGEIARMVDTGIGMTVGSCSFGDFVPYTLPPAG